MKTTVKVNQQGELYIVFPEDIIDDLMIEEGDVVTFFDDGTGEIILTF